MKTYIIYIVGFLFLVLNFSCSSDKNFDLSQFELTPSNNIGETVTIKVKEYKTNLPIAGAIFSTYYCKGYDIEFGRCINKVLLSSCITNNNGSCNCSFPKKAFEKITIEKSMYRSKYFTDSNGDYILQPEAWVSIDLKTNVAYPTTSTFFITIKGELGYNQTYVSAVNNSNATLTLYGNEENKVDWVLYKTFNSTSELLNSGSFTLKPNKFENLTYTLTY